MPSCFHKELVDSSKSIFTEGQDALTIAIPNEQLTMNTSATLSAGN